MFERNEQKDKALSEHENLGQESSNKLIVDVFSAHADNARNVHASGKTDATKEISEEAKQIASIVKNSTDVREAAENPKLEKLLAAASDSKQLDALVSATNKILENPQGEFGYNFLHVDAFGMLLRKEDRADSTITSDDPRFAGPFTEKQLDAAAEKIAHVVSENGTFGEETVKHEINQTFGRALRNHQEDELLEKINGDNLGDADIAGTHQYIVKQALGINWHGNHMSKFTLINDDVAIVPALLDQARK